MHNTQVTSEGTRYTHVCGYVFVCMCVSMSCMYVFVSGVNMYVCVFVSGVNMYVCMCL